jgi:VIT1/CCC1 family predicted Fe2+/Mn2+ transporter
LPDVNSRIHASILAVSDGVCSISGVIAGGAAGHVGHGALGRTALGGAFAATISMAGAEFNSEDKTDWGAVGAMGAGTVAGAALPAIPLLVLASWAVWPAVVAVSLLVALGVGEVRHRATGRTRAKAWLQTLAVLALGGAVGYLAGGV